jgi:large subunit ribosomal protein L23
MRVQDVVRRPLLTEKSTLLREEKSVVVFEVAPGANKIEIKRAVEALFKGAKVADVRIARMHGKVRRQGRFVGQRPDWKKAYVRLAADSKPIEFFEGV